MTQAFIGVNSCRIIVYYKISFGTFEFKIVLSFIKMKLNLFAIAEKLKQKRRSNSKNDCLETLNQTAQESFTYSKMWHQMSLAENDLSQLFANRVEILNNPNHYNSYFSRRLTLHAAHVLKSSSSTISQILLEIHDMLLIKKSGFRVGSVRANSGVHQVVSQFPNWTTIPSSLQSLEVFRNSSPLCEFWTTLLIYNSILRLHPFSDGNGRAARAFLAYELWRHGCSPIPNFSFAQALDVNRSLEIDHHFKVSSAQCELSLSKTVADNLCFVADVIAISQKHFS